MTVYKIKHHAPLAPSRSFTSWKTPHARPVIANSGSAWRLLGVTGLATARFCARVNLARLSGGRQCSERRPCLSKKTRAKTIKIREQLVHCDTVLRYRRDKQGGKEG
ncbi:MAG: hypothetical protein ACPIOQ_16780, partial [Promethearchaeia archaeon]